MARPEVNQAWQADENRPVEQTAGSERRAYPRHAVDCPVIVLSVSGSMHIQGRLSDLSLGGCLVVAEQRYTAGIQVRVEVQFQLRGIAFRIVGVTVGSRETKSFAVRFLDMPARRRQELSEMLEEVAATNAAKALEASKPKLEVISAAIEERVRIPEPISEAISKPAIQPSTSSISSDPGQVVPPPKAIPSELQSALPERPQALPAATARERRAQGRHAVDTSAKLLLVKTAISMPGRILNLSMGGCRIRTEERFNVGIYVRVEAEFYLHGLPFRIGGVSQAILDKNTIGVRFLDMSERRREQLAELIAEIAEAAALEPAAGFTGIVDERGKVAISG